MDSVQYLLESLLETIEEQIEAAKTLDTEKIIFGYRTSTRFVI